MSKTPTTLRDLTDTQILAEKLTAEDEDGWTYVAVVMDRQPLAALAVFDETGALLGYL